MKWLPPKQRLNKGPSHLKTQAPKGISNANNSSVGLKTAVIGQKTSEA